MKVILNNLKIRVNFGLNMYFSETVYPKIELGRMTWPEVKERVEEDPMTPVIILFSATEQHGYHLPFNTDQLSTCYTWINAAKAVKDDVKPVLTPLMPFGVEWEHMGFPGTITLSTRTLTQVTKEIVRSLYLNGGFKKFAIIPGCGGQQHALAFRMAIVELYEEFGPNIFLMFRSGRAAFMTPEEEADLKKKLDYSPVKAVTGHGGESETSTALFLQPDDVNFDKAVDTIAPGTNQPILPEWVNLPEDTDWDWFAKFEPSVNWPYPRFKERGSQIGPVGSIGYATRATAKKGEIQMKASVERAIRFLKWFKKIKITPKSVPEHKYHFKP
jgi:creatinine amidohydrolase